jgi:hypothetical protein
VPLFVPLCCSCTPSVVQWYLDKGLATMEKEDPPTIRLLFEHKNADQQVRHWSVGMGCTTGPRWSPDKVYKLGVRALGCCAVLCYAVLCCAVLCCAGSA